VTIANELYALTTETGGVLDEKRDGFSLKMVIAERKTFLSRKKLVYQARIRIDEARREVILSERLLETGFGLAGGSDDWGSSPGLGFKKETYRIGGDGQRTGGIEEQSRLFGKKYAYCFEFDSWRGKIRQAVETAGFTLSCRMF
jgi:hypothetical protein